MLLFYFENDSTAACAQCRVNGISNFSGYELFNPSHLLTSEFQESDDQSSRLSLVRRLSNTLGLDDVRHLAIGESTHGLTVHQAPGAVKLDQHLDASVFPVDG